MMAQTLRQAKASGNWRPETGTGETSVVDERARCAWVSNDPLYRRYHDEEWGRPEHDAQKLFELLLLESFQAGLSWITILRKRENFRQAFAGFKPEQIARFGDADVQALVTNAAIIRHRGKIEAAIAGARAWLDLEATFPGGFTAFIWETVEGKPQINYWRNAKEIPAKTPEAAQLSKRLRDRGFRFVGATTTYSFMQAAGLVDDHLLSCFRREGASL
jgi:DNA-3-methyladenine glycosylase I